MGRNLPEYVSRPYSSKDKSKKQEKRSAKDYDGITTSASGARGNKGDVNLKSGFKLENKTTDKNSIRVEKKWLDKIEEEAFEVGVMPLLEIELQDQQWVIMRKEDFIKFLEIKENATDILED